jgi:hypothetical protein
MSRDARDRGEDPELVAPLDAADPRFLGSGDVEDAPTPARPRRLVPNDGPGASRFDPRVRALRAAIPLVVLGGILVTMVVFWQGLDPASGRQVVGDEAAVRAAVAERPHRVCLGGGQPCAWLTVVDGRLLALNTSGPLREEFGRAGVTWCASSGWFGSNSLGSRFDQAGVLAKGPAPRGLDRYDLTIDDEGRVVLNFFSLNTALQAARVDSVRPPEGPHCDEIPFDREADLEL